MGVYSLALEGSTYAGSVALLLDDVVIAERTLADIPIPSKEGREERMLPSVAECLAEAGVAVGEIGRLICGAGPGSFTSLRVAASIAKGIAVGRGVPMYAVSSLLLSVACACDSRRAGPGRYLSVLAAMRGDWFALPVEVTDQWVVGERGVASLIRDTDLSRVALDQDVRLLGPGQDIDARPHARGVASLLHRIIQSGLVDIETWEPDYGRLAEAQVRWEAAHGRPLGAGA